jgi:PAS domain S-box-containing protein
MRIVTRISLIVIIPIIIGITISTIQLYASDRMVKAMDDNASSLQLQEDIFTLNLLMSEISNHPRELRPRRQWQNRHQALSSVLNELIYKQRLPADVLGKLHQSLRYLAEQFDRIELAADADTPERVKEELMSSITGMMLLTTRKMVDDVQQLVQHTNKQMLRVRELSDIGTLGVLLVMVVLLGTIAIFMGQRIIKPVLALRKGTDEIGAGRLDYRLPITAHRDELADMAVAFNEMLERLQHTLASRDELNREVEARKRSEDGLRSAHRQLEQIIEFLPDATFVLNEDKQVVAWNRAMEEMTGTSKEEILGQSDYAYAVPFYGERRPIAIDLVNNRNPEVEKFYDSVEQVGDRLYAESYIPALYEGRGAYVLAAASPLFDTEGNPSGSIESVRDISALKEAEDERLARMHQVQQHQETILTLSTAESIANGIVENAFATIAEKSAEVLNIHRVSLWMYKEEESLISCCELYANGKHEAAPEIVISAEEYPGYVEALRSGRAVDASDAETDPRTIEFLDIYLRPYGIKSILDAPIRVGGKIVGMIRHESLTGHKWSTEEISFASEIADQAAQALINRDRREAQDALSLSEEKYRHLLANLPQKVFYKDHEGKYVAVNTSYSHDFGLEPEAFIGKDDYAFYPTELAEKYRRDEKKIIDEGIIHEMDEEYLHEGALKIVHTIKAPVYDEMGIARGVLGIFWDVTENRRAQEEIKIAREFLRNVINSMPAVLVVIDTQGYITHWNYAAASQTNISEEAAVGKMLADLPLLPEAILTKTLDTANNGEATTLLNQSYREGKQPRSVDITIYPVTINGTGGTVIIIEDVTERVRVESMMVQTEKMMSVGGLAAGMAHELNSPLGGMMQGMQNIRRRISPEMKKNMEVAAEIGIDLEKLQSYLEKRNVLSLMEGITDAGVRAANIVDNMMNFSRTLTESITPLNISELLDSVIELASLDYDLKKKYGFREITIVRDYATDLPYVPCLEKEIKQVILNLLRNAAQAMSTQQDRTEPASITLRTRLEGEMAHIEVEDNGPGMEPAVRERVFEPFFTTRDVGEGTGLGLSVAYYLIHEQHHGSIDVESQPGKGTCFIINLPLKQAIANHG